MNVQAVFRDVIRRADNETDAKIVPLADRLITRRPHMQQHCPQLSVNDPVSILNER
jgi:hypothetical protein